MYCLCWLIFYGHCTARKHTSVSFRVIKCERLSVEIFDLYCIPNHEILCMWVQNTGKFCIISSYWNITSQKWTIECPKDFGDTILINTFFLYNLEHSLEFWGGAHSVHSVHHVLWEGIMHSSQEFTQNYAHNVSNSWQNWCRKKWLLTTNAGDLRAVTGILKYILVSIFLSKRAFKSSRGRAAITSFMSP